MRGSLGTHLQEVLNSHPRVNLLNQTRRILTRRPHQLIRTARVEWKVSCDVKNLRSDDQREITRKQKYKYKLYL